MEKESFQRGLILDSAPKERVSFDWNDQLRDPQGVYSVDCRINGMERPLFVHALASDAKTRDATIALLQLEKWEMPFSSLAIFEDRKEIGRNVITRFSDVCENENQVESLAGNHNKVKRIISEAIASNNGG